MGLWSTFECLQEINGLYGGCMGVDLGWIRPVGWFREVID